MKLPYHWKLYALAVLLVLAVPGTCFALYGWQTAIYVFAGCLVLYIAIDILVLARKQEAVPDSTVAAAPVPFHGSEEDWAVLEKHMGPAIEENLISLDRELADGVLDDKGYTRQVRRLIRKYCR